MLTDKFYSSAIGDTVTVSEAEAELEDLRSYYSNDKEWPEHRVQAQVKARRIVDEIAAYKQAAKP